MSQTQQSVVFLAVFAVWITFLYIRIFDKVLKKYIALIGMLLEFWMIVKIIKNYFTGNAEYILWYLYYIPLLFIPNFYFNCSSYLYERKNRKIRAATLLVSLALFILVITNGLHNFVFKMIVSGDDYVHNVGYYIICAWIIILMTASIVYLMKMSKKNRLKSTIIISAIVAASVLYAVLYITNNKYIRSTNMSVFAGIAFCGGLEALFDFYLIPNNFEYKKIFKNSNLPLEIISNDGTARLKTNHIIDIEDRLIYDLTENEVKPRYDSKDKIHFVKKIKGGIAVAEKDLETVNELSDELKKTNEELLLQESALEKQRDIKINLYEAKITNEIIELLDEKIEAKRNLINEMLDDMESADVKKMTVIKLLINYCKRMSGLVISSYNNESYDNKRFSIIINELFTEAESLGINGAFQSNSFCILSEETADVYDIIFEVVMNVENTDFVLNMRVFDDRIELKFLFSRKEEGIKEKIKKLEKENLIELKEKTEDDETVLCTRLKRGKTNL